MRVEQLEVRLPVNSLKKGRPYSYRDDTWRRLKKLPRRFGTFQGKAQAAEVDALNETAVNTYLDDVVNQAGRIDIVFNAMGLEPDEYDNGKTTIEISYQKFMIPMTTYAASNFLTARAAARHMLKRHSGVVIFLSGTPSKGVAPNLAASRHRFWSC